MAQRLLHVFDTRAGRKPQRQIVDALVAGGATVVRAVDDDGARADMVSEGNVLYVYGNSGELVAYEITAKE